ncbi:MAG: hypothetical protein ABI824_14110 [Acidobacteriota bacterium]
MTRALFTALLFALLLTGCGSIVTEPGLKAFVGGRMEPGLDAEPIPYSIIIVADGKIKAAGPQASTPVPKGAETISTKDKVVTPMPYSATIAAGQPANLMIRDNETGLVQIYSDGKRVQ